LQSAAAGGILAFMWDVTHVLSAIEQGDPIAADRRPTRRRSSNYVCFAGLTVDEVARSLGISTSTADRHWILARAWLYRRIVGDAEL
jgi:hypothetical protein